VLLDHGEEVAEESPLLGRQLLSDRVGTRSAGRLSGLADAGVAPTRVAQLDALGQVAVLPVAR